MQREQASCQRPSRRGDSTTLCVHMCLSVCTCTCARVRVSVTVRVHACSVLGRPDSGLLQ